MFSGLPESGTPIYALIMPALVQGRIRIALRLGSAVDGTQAVQLSASARVIAAGPHEHHAQGARARRHQGRITALHRR